MISCSRDCFCLYKITNPHFYLFHVAFSQVDKYQNTSASNIYALGDVCGNVELTPMAIAAARRLADRYIFCLYFWYDI